MHCPKCSTRLRAEQSFFGSSGLLRQVGGVGTNVISGFSCWKCGYWRDAEIVPVVCGVPQLATAPKREYDPVEKTAIHYIVTNFFDSIKAQRESGASWYAIAKLLSQAGQRCQEKTLQKYFLAEHSKRCSHEKTA